MNDYDEYPIGDYDYADWESEREMDEEDWNDDWLNEEDEYELELDPYLEDL